MNTIEDCPANKKGLLLRPGVWDSPAPDTQRQAHVIPSDFKQHDLWQLLEEIDNTRMMKISAPYGIGYLCILALLNSTGATPQTTTQPSYSTL